MAGFQLQTILLLSIAFLGFLILAKYLNENTPVYRFPHHIPRKDATAPREINGVPLVIYQSWGTHEIPKYMKKNIESVLNKNPEFDYYLYSDEECHMFIQHNFEPDVLAAFNSLRPGAYKSDLWRYCVLYVKGGVYMDIKMKPLIPLRKFIEAQPYVFVKDFELNIQPRANECMWNGFMIAPPGFPIFKYCIEEIVKSCQQKNYMRNSLDITGPCLLGRVVKKYDARKFMHYNMLFLTESASIYWNTDKVITKYSQYREEQKKYQRSEHYDKLWKTKKVYHE